MAVALCAGAAIENIFTGAALRQAFPSLADWLPPLVVAAAWPAVIPATLACIGLAAAPRLTSAAWRSLLAGLVGGALAAGLWCIVAPPRAHRVTLISIVEGKPAQLSFAYTRLSPGTWPPFGPDYARYLEAFAAILLAAVVWGAVAQRRPV